MTCPFGFGAVDRALGAADDREEEAGHAEPGAAGGEQVHYPGYLQLDKILGAQKMLSHDPAKNKPVHDEHLFIVIHQAFELWFKQMLHEIHSITELFNYDEGNGCINSTDLLTVSERLGRVVAILKVCNAQFAVLETMTAMNFLEFRNFLAPASGFQSSQFRLVENVLGQRPESRVKYQKEHYWKHLGTDTERERVRESEGELTLRHCVDRWLAGMQGKTQYGFDFFEAYKKATRAMLSDQRGELEDPTQAKLDQCAKNEASYEQIFDERLYNVAVERGDRRFSHDAIKGLLMVMHYRDHPAMNQPYTILVRLMDIDQHLMTFRVNHASLVQRMIGNRMGTGGSSGYMYLKSTCSDRYKVFLDIFQISAYMLPNSYRPTLPSELATQLNFGAKPSAMCDAVHKRK